jgi:16S rRNA (adenine1518-N6/adenine1519-N6)-dimethyltransferase
MKRIIVDENDNPIGAKEKGEITKNDIYRVSSLLLENSKGEILLSQRSFNKRPENNPGKWSPSANGTVEVGETYFSNLVKEIQEELGLTGLELRKLGKTLVRRNTTFFVESYGATLDIDPNDLKLKEDEVEQAKWFDKSELRKLLKTNPEMFVPEFEEVTKDFI